MPESERTILDPSALSTQALWREITHLKELLETRIEGIEKAIDVAHENSVRVPTEIQKAVGNLENLHNEKFASVQNQFVDRDKRTDLALQAARELVAQQNISASQSSDKQVANFSKQFDQIGTLLQSNYAALNDKITAFDSRLTRIESRGEGRKDFWGWIIGAIGLVAAVIGIVMAVR